MASANHYPNFHTEPDAREPRDARRRRELIEATIESIARNGLSGTTIAKVAEIANLSAGIVSFYFRTK
ncbi:MAG: TetR family transcriptional regulator, partial [Myxococcota bacterium]